MPRNRLCPVTTKYRLIIQKIMQSIHLAPLEVPVAVSDLELHVLTCGNECGNPPVHYSIQYVSYISSYGTSQKHNMSIATVIETSCSTVLGVKQGNEVLHQYCKIDNCSDMSPIRCFQRDVSIRHETSNWAHIEHVITTSHLKRQVPLAPNKITSHPSTVYTCV